MKKQPTSRALALAMIAKMSQYKSKLQEQGSLSPAQKRHMLKLRTVLAIIGR